MRTIRSGQVVSVRITRREVEPAVRAESQAMQTPVIPVTETPQNHCALVSASIAIRILQGDQFGRVSRVKLALVPNQPHRWSKFFREYTPPLVAAIAIAILKHADPTPSH